MYCPLCLHHNTTQAEIGEYQEEIVKFTCEGCGAIWTMILHGYAPDSNTKEICIKCLHYIEENGCDHCAWFDVDLDQIHDAPNCSQFAHKPTEEQ